jgi:hypothetical protein
MDNIVESYDAFLNEATKNTPEVQALIDGLISTGVFKKYELGVEQYVGVYFITLPITACNIKTLNKIIDVIPADSNIGIYKSLSSALSIKTPYKI